MRVRCLSNQNSLLDPSSVLYSSDPAVVLDIEVGQEYLVYAISFDDRGIVYYLCGLNYTYYPHWYPGQLFDVIDARLSQYWEYSSILFNGKRTSGLVLAYHEWAVDSNLYYWSLTEHDCQAIDTWIKYKALIEEEFIASDKINT